MVDPFPKIDSETLEVESFLDLNGCEIKTKQVTALIGPQASGKSVIAKIHYFFRDYLHDLYISGLESSHGRLSFNRQKLSEFNKLFPGASGGSNGFRLSYSFGETAVSIEKPRRSSTTKIILGNQEILRFDKVRREYKKWLKQMAEEKERRFRPMNAFSFLRAAEAVDGLFSSLPSALHVPASRAFFSTIQDNVFTFLAEQETLDPLMVQFGRFFEYAKTDYAEGLSTRRKRDLTEQEAILKEVLCGLFLRDGTDYCIQTKWGRVPLRNSSSGQQEALPLLLSMLLYPSKFRKNDLLIVEEPEAHLFPRAQKRVLELIVSQSISEKCNIMITTHSPYILSCLNNEIHKSKRTDSPISVASYFVDEGSARDMVDYDDDLIDLSALDEVSEEIARDFTEWYS